jgi:hypothetical protein
MGKPFYIDSKICGFDHFCSSNFPKNSIWTNFTSVLTLFFAFFVLDTEFLDTPPPPHALHIWNAQDLHFQKKWVNRSTCIDSKICGFDHFCSPLAKNSIWTNFAFFVLNIEILSTPQPHMPYIFGMLRTCTFIKNGRIGT